MTFFSQILTKARRALRGTPESFWYTLWKAHAMWPGIADQTRRPQRARRIRQHDERATVRYLQRLDRWLREEPQTLDVMGPCPRCTGLICACK